MIESEVMESLKKVSLEEEAEEELIRDLNTVYGPVDSYEEMMRIIMLDDDDEET